MKKRLFLLPLLAAGMLCGCGEDDAGGNTPTPPSPVQPDDPTGHTHSWSSWKSDENGHWKTCSGCSELGSQGAHTFDGNICSVCGYQKQVTPVGPTALAATLNFDNISAAVTAAGGTGTGYAAVQTITSFADHTVSFQNVCINMLDESSTPAWTTGGTKVNVVQFKNPKNGCGIITFTDAIATKVTINLLTSYDVDNDFKVSYGGTSQTMSVGAGQSTGWQSSGHAISKYALTFNLSGTGGDLVIQNQGQGARYVESIVIE